MTAPAGPAPTGTADRTPHPGPLPPPAPAPAPAPAGARHGSAPAHDKGEPARAARLEAALGDPFDPRNPNGHLALVRADDARHSPHATEALLARHRLSAEFVPHDLGGRLTDLEQLARVLRPLFRRDLAAGYGFGVTSLFAASSVWTAGDPAQRTALAGVLLGGGRAAIVHREVAHANAILRREVAATPAPGGGHLLNGSKDAVMNADRTDTFVVYARTSPGHGPHSHSVFLLTGPPERGQVQRLPRVQMPGMRGARFSGLRLSDVHLPDSALVGTPGQGITLALRSFQISHCLIPGTVLAGVDGVLRLAVRAATEHRPGHQPARRWHKALSGVFADLLACDAMAVTALRALSLAPKDAYLLAAAVKYTMPDLLREDLEELAAVLGARGYDRGPLYGGFQKLARDLPVAGLGHSGTAVCQAVLVPQLAALARTAWFRSAEGPAELFTPGAPLPPLDHTRLTHSGTGDLLAATLIAAAERLSTHSAGPLHTTLATLARTLVAELRTLRDRCAQLPASSTAVDPLACALADRYALLLSAAACLGVFEGQTGHDTFLADPAWAVLALSRIARRLGAPVPDLPPQAQQTVLAEALDRCRHGHSLDLYATALAH
ncbi:acyl-CoA dehydrogenase [Streptomyces sp. NPDC047853]|uniref:acyl-CoA dehydrogenase n=1 Tax=unclassified Streptomyces TaxID=2593676 RepID=UPI00345684F5